MTQICPGGEDIVERYTPAELRPLLHSAGAHSLQQLVALSSQLQATPRPLDVAPRDTGTILQLT